MGEPGGQPQMAEMPKMPSMWPMMIVMIMTFGLYFIDGMGNEHRIGIVLNYVFQFIDFGGKYPVLTLMLMGSIMILLSSVVRTLMMDSIEQQKAQTFNSAFQKELRQARIENNLYKVKKLMELQPVMMSKSMESSSQMMKSMPLTMLIVIPIFLWVRYFVDVTLTGVGMQIISVPWSLVSLGGGVNLMTIYWFIPAWILIYSMVSIPLGQIITRLVRMYQFKKRLKEIESGTDIEVS